MKVRQVSVFLENRSGRIAKITTILGNAGINIRAMALADTSDFGILRLVMTDTDKGVELLRDNGFTVKVTDVIAVSITDKPGALGELLTVLETAGLNLEYVYVLNQMNPQKAVLIIRFDDPDNALSIMLDKELHVLSEETVLSM
jgi:hypothetical protein